MSIDNSDHILEQVKTAFGKKSPLRISAGDSKSFYGNHVEGDVVSTEGHTGIITYQPSELVITVRSGTLLSELESELKANRQMLAFEPPQHSATSTIGGAIACGLSGPRRMACGAARDFVLGTTIINGKAEKLRFGGQVMKNVAGYDASRLMVGAQGTLGILLDLSIKVLPMSEAEVTLQFNTELITAISHLRQWIKQGLPITASCFTDNTLTLRLSSTSSAVKASTAIIQTLFDSEEFSNDFWLSIKNQSHAFFAANNLAKDQLLWRCSHQTNTHFYPDDNDTGDQLIEWNGALRWIKSNKTLYNDAEKHNGHATLYPINQANLHTDIFQRMQPALMKIQQRMKQAFDPESILNTGRLYTDL